MNDNGLSWSFYQVWNESLEQREVRQLTARDRIWASELGGTFIDRYLKMTAVPYTNPPNARSLRKFEAGNIWEWIVGLILKRAGVYIQLEQLQLDGAIKKDAKWIKYQYPQLLAVTGKLDHMAGGKPDWEKSGFDINALDLPPFLTKASLNIIEHFKKNYSQGLKRVILEVKSCSSFMFDLYERTGTASPQHKLQAFHYLKGKDMDEAHIVYICRDDARMLEIGITNPSPLEEKYKEDIQTITGYYNSRTRPPLERFLNFSQDFGKFSANYKVGYSNYLTKLYGLKNQMEFDDIYKPKATQFNRVLGRVIREDRMTDKNKVILEEMEKEFGNLEPIIAKAKELKTVLAESEIEEDTKEPLIIEATI